MISKNLAIATLAVVGVVLLCTLALQDTFRENTAFARSMSQQGGGLIVTTTMVGNETEAVVITDTNRDPGRMNLYIYDGASNRVLLTDIIDLEETAVFGAAPQEQEQRRSRRPNQRSRRSRSER